MATILITGGAGFIGSNLVRHALARTAHRLVVVDRLTYAGSLSNLEGALADPRVSFVQADIADRAAMARLFADARPSAVVNLAAETHVDRSIDAPAAFVESNVVGTFTLLEAARLHLRERAADERARFRFLQVSTDEVYGALGPAGAFTETTAYAPRSPYAASKAAADHLVQAYFHTYGLPTLLTNCSNNYGPFQFPEKLVPLTILNAVDRRPLPVYGDGLQVRDWLHVSDHCEGLLLALEGGRPGEKYNMGGGSELTNLDVVNRICDALDARLPGGAPHAALRTFVPDRPGHDRRYAIDPAKIHRELGWTPRRRFDEGLAETVDWYLSHRPWCEAVLAGRYDRGRLGLGR